MTRMPKAARKERPRVYALPSLIVVLFVALYLPYGIFNHDQQQPQPPYPLSAYSTPHHYHLGPTGVLDSLPRVGIDPESTLASSVTGIWHDAPQSALIVKTTPLGRCPSPLLRGRLSGPALALLEWQRWDDHTLVGTYQEVPFPGGTFFVEIVALYCDGTAWEREPKLDFVPLCLENPLHHRVTQRGASISVRTAQNSTTTDTKEPRFVWVSTTMTQQQNVQPLYTRIQPQNCRGENSSSSQFCQSYMDLHRFAPYRLQWNFKHVHQQLVAALQQQGPRKKLCVVGWSHARVLWNSLKLYLSDAHVGWGLARYPSEVTYRFVQNLTQSERCTHLVIGLGQWPGSGLSVPGVVHRQPRYLGKGPMLFAEYERELRQMLQRIVDTSSTSWWRSGRRRRLLLPRRAIYLRSIHDNPIGDAIGACPPSDWRSPPVMDGYNRIVQRLANEFGVPFLDTRRLMLPMWDNAPDWCHYDNAVGEHEALYLAAQVLLGN